MRSSHLEIKKFLETNNHDNKLALQKLINLGIESETIVINYTYTIINAKNPGK